MFFVELFSSLKGAKATVFQGEVIDCEFFTCFNWSQSLHDNTAFNTAIVHKIEAIWIATVFKATEVF